MAITFTWGPDAANANLGSVQDVPSIIDWAMLDTGTVNSSTATSSYIEFSGMLEGVALVMVLEGTALATSNGALSGGNVTSISIYRDTGGALGDPVLTIEGPLDGSVLHNLAFQEVTGSDTSAIEDYFLSLDWIYNGTNEVDDLPANATSPDGVPYNLAGDDIATLAGGSDRLALGNGNDLAYGGGGGDALFGGKGNDDIYGGAGRDFIKGGNGKDEIYGGAKGDLLEGNKGNDKIFGGGGSDIFFGGDGKDSLYGGKGRDNLFSGDGNDKLFGGKGSDFLFGGKGNDVIKGGGGSDLLLFDAQSGADKVKGFDLAEDTLVFIDEIDQNDIDIDVTIVSFADMGIDFTTVEALVDDYMTVTDQGVLIDFEQGSTVLLQGVDSLEGLEDAILLFSDFL